jgi:hypothetical protein
MKMKTRFVFMLLTLSVILAPALFAMDNLRLNPNLDYGSDRLDGALLTGTDAQSGFVADKPNYVIIYGEGCFNSKRQARRTVELYNKYRSQVHFVVVDLDVERSPEQQELVRRYYKGYIPHVIVLDGRGNPLYDQSGEVDSGVIENIFQKLLSQ